MHLVRATSTAVLLEFLDLDLDLASFFEFELDENSKKILRRRSVASESSWNIQPGRCGGGLSSKEALVKRLLAGNRSEITDLRCLVPRNQAVV